MSDVGSHDAELPVLVMTASTDNCSIEDVEDVELEDLSVSEMKPEDLHQGVKHEPDEQRSQHDTDNVCTSVRVFSSV